MTNGPLGQVLSIAFTSDSKLMAWVVVDKTMYFGIRPRNQIGGRSGAHGYSSSVAFSPDDKQLASGSADNSIKIWDIAAFVKSKR